MLKRRTRTFTLISGLALVLLVVAGILVPVHAAPDFQLTPFPTPTPGLDGRIIYTVQDQDTLWRISAVSGVSLDELRQLNSLDADAVIRPGQVLLLGVVSPQQVTPAPGTALDPALQPTPTATVLADASQICALLYLDENGDAVRQESEIALADGEVSVTERLGAYSEKGTTAYNNDTDPLCFENIPPGEYIVTIALPGGFNRTTPLSVTIQLLPGDTSYLNFGAQPTSIFEPLTDTANDGSGSRSNLLVGILGATLLLGGAGVGVWAVLNNRRRFFSSDD